MIEQQQCALFLILVQTTWWKDRGDVNEIEYELESDL